MSRPELSESLLLTMSWRLQGWNLFILIGFFIVLVKASEGSRAEELIEEGGKDGGDKGSETRLEIAHVDATLSQAQKSRTSLSSAAASAKREEAATYLQMMTAQQTDAKVSSALHHLQTKFAIAASSAEAKEHIARTALKEARRLAAAAKKAQSQLLSAEAQEKKTASALAHAKEEAKARLAAKETAIKAEHSSSSAAASAAKALEAADAKVRTLQDKHEHLKEMMAAEASLPHNR